jgi:hypothetical protein
MDASIAAVAKPGDIVFVAGVGPVDAALIGRLQDVGAQMCGDVREVCSQSWNSNKCAALRALYSPLTSH